MSTLSFKSEGVSRVNREGKPNEDYFLVDNLNLIYVVCDGVTRSDYSWQPTNKSPSAQASYEFAITVHACIKHAANTSSPKEILLKAIAEGNQAVRRLNRSLFDGKIDFWTNDLAGTVALVGLIRNDTFYFAYNGDCAAYLLSSTNVQKLTHEQTILLEERYKGHVIDRELATIVRRDIRNTTSHPCAYGVFTGEEGAMEFVELKEVSLYGAERIILTTDGLSGLLSSHPFLMKTLSVEAMVDAAEDWEDRNQARKDDKTVISVRIA